MLLETRDTCYWSESCVFSSFYVYLKTKKSLSKNKKSLDFLTYSAYVINDRKVIGLSNMRSWSTERRGYTPPIFFVWMNYG